jgi:hypothetical protein
VGRELTFWTIRLATLFYALAVFARLRNPKSPLAGRIPWTLGCIFYLIHVALAFEFFHGWSHASAVQETARRTWEMFGVASGSGIYWNYVFTAVWVADAAWWWISALSHCRRPKWLTCAIHGFMGFLFFNAVIIFGSPLSRWFGALVLLALAAYVGCRKPRRYIA